ncbi:MAG TPA: alpha/beta hydrolase-fold protein [Candidatus Binatia bacterium]|jgi:S-formylglutathione hydrolase FrmB|nr:alpha/beta hydrolase-fold protein [Candidatus Binatia bacterium]
MDRPRASSKRQLGAAARACLTIIVAVGLLALEPAPAAAGELQTFELPSTLVDPSTPGGRLEHGRTVPKVHVLLPDGYRADSKRGYPVLWLLHGANGGTDTWIPGITTLAAGFPGIVVMPDGGLFGMYINWSNAGVRGAPAWSTYHLEVVRQEIERRYRIRPERRWHAIGGISMGGQGALRYAAMLPGYFGSVVGFSAALADMQSDIARLGLDLLAAGNAGTTYEAIFGSADGAFAEGNNPQALAINYAHTRVYVTSGNGVNCPGDPKGPTFDLDVITETAINTLQGPFADAVRAVGAKATDTTTCGVHTFGVWDRAFVDARAWGFFGPVPKRPRHWVYRTVATAGEMWGLRFEFAEPPATVVDFDRAGPTLSATGTGTVEISGPRNCHFTADLPFERRLPRACLRAS